MSKIVALPWYHRSDWPALHAEFVDRESVTASYDIWKANAIARETKWRCDGYNVQRVELRPEPFREWCRAMGRKADHASRRAYADELLNKRRLETQAVPALTALHESFA